MKIAVVWDWVNEPLQITGWQDGIFAMIRELRRKADVRIFTQMTGITKETEVLTPSFPVSTFPGWEDMCASVESWGPDTVLFWADFTRPAIQRLTEQFPSAILFAGGEPILQNTSRFKKIFVESAVYKERLEVAGFPVEQAFGTNTELFAPKSQPKMFDVFFPACFAAWKRHDLFASSVKGMRALACGWFQEHEPWCYKACQEAGVMTIPHVPAHLLPDFYNASRCVLITSDSTGGSQRSVLEAMACNIPCIVMEDSDKTSEYIRQAGLEILISAPDQASIQKTMSNVLSLNPSHPVFRSRDFIMEHYSEYIYANKVYSALCQLV
jgi:glycosyltransferase involved in cell wall biosynthesis